MNVNGISHKWSEKKDFVDRYKGYFNFITNLIIKDRIQDILHENKNLNARDLSLKCVVQNAIGEAFHTRKSEVLKSLGGQESHKRISTKTLCEIMMANNPENCDSESLLSAEDAITDETLSSSSDIELSAMEAIYKTGEESINIRTRLINELDQLGSDISCYRVEDIIHSTDEELLSILCNIRSKMTSNDQARLSRLFDIMTEVYWSCGTKETIHWYQIVNDNKENICGDEEWNKINLPYSASVGDFKNEVFQLCKGKYHSGQCEDLSADELKVYKSMDDIQCGRQPLDNNLYIGDYGKIKDDKLLVVIPSTLGVPITSLKLSERNVRRCQHVWGKKKCLSSDEMRETLSLLKNTPAEDSWLNLKEALQQSEQFTINQEHRKMVQNYLGNQLASILKDAMLNQVYTKVFKKILDDPEQEKKLILAIKKYIGNISSMRFDYGNEKIYIYLKDVLQDDERDVISNISKEYGDDIKDNVHIVRDAVQFTFSKLESRP